MNADEKANYPLATDSSPFRFRLIFCPSQNYTKCWSRKIISCDIRDAVNKRALLDAANFQPTHLLRRMFDKIFGALR